MPGGRDPFYHVNTYIWRYQYSFAKMINICFVVRGESPGCRLFGTASMLECLKPTHTHTHTHTHTPLTGEQYRKMEPKYPEGGHCQSVLHPQVFFNVPLYFE